jgi:SAM-dependent methyltransferase
MSLVLDEHRQYLSDNRRLDAFRRAIAEAVKPGDVVMDLGSGTGILGMLACEAGATRVYAVDGGGMSGIAGRIARANGLQDRIVCINGLSTRIELPEKVDVVIADQIGHFGFEAGMLTCFNDAHRRHLKPGGHTIPSSVDLCVGAVQRPEVWEQVEFWNRPCAGFDFSPASMISANTSYPIEFAGGDLLSGEAALASLDLGRFIPARFAGAVSLVITHAGILHGIGGWFWARLSPAVTMSNSPASPERITRPNVYFPVERPVPVQPGDTVRVAMDVVHADKVVTWKVEVSNPSGVVKAKFSHTTFRGMLICPEDLEKTRPGFAPRLSLWGEARRSVVNLCDGIRTLGEIEAEVFRRHQNLFSSADEAAAFVVEVMLPDAETDSGYRR